MARAFEGLRAVAYVDCRSKLSTKKTRSKLGRFRLRTPSKSLNTADIHSDESTTEEHSARNASSEATLLEWKQELKMYETNLNDREAELLRAEEEMIDRMNEHVVKAAELEQWEENLFHRERMLMEKQTAEKSKKISKG